jgi:RNA polymerase sigma factor (sigma-70 family)
MLDRLNAALLLLSDDERALIRAIFFDGVSTKEIAKMENVDQSTVNRHKLKILAKLRKIMESRF